MDSKYKTTFCILLTAIVLHTCIRIEILNARAGTFLPRKMQEIGIPKWREAGTRPFLKHLETFIAMERLNSHVSQHPSDSVPEIEAFIGPPYTDAEQAWIDSEMAEHNLNSQLRAWVGVGLFQYLLAPVALVSSLMLFRRTKSIGLRLAMIACAVSNLTSMYFMVYRGYYTSLGG